jgi:hypothetical protein
MSQLDSIGIAKQVAFGTKQTTAEYYMDVEGATVDGKPEFLDIPTTVGYKFPKPLDTGTQTYKVGLDMIPRVASFPRVLSAFWGASTPTTVDTSAKKHSFDPVAASALIYHSIRMSRVDAATDIIDLPYDCAGNTLSISATVGDFLKAKASMLAANNDATLAAPTVTLDATSRLKWHNVKLYANADAGGEAEIKCNAFEWVYNTGLEDDHFVLGQQSLAALPVGFQTSELKFTLTEEDATAFVTWYRRVLALTSRSSIVFRLDGTVGTTLIGAATQTLGLAMKGWNAEIIDAPADIDAKTRMRQIEITARMNYDTVNSKFVTADVYNLVASY